MRLGPEPGEEVAAYLQRLPAELPAPGVEALALVQFAAELPQNRDAGGRDFALSPRDIDRSGTA